MIVNERTIDMSGIVYTMFKTDPDWFIQSAKGIIHVGASFGQERDLYKRYNLPVIWVEPISYVFDVLVSNLNGYENQKAFKYLVTDKDGVEYPFHISSNEGMSSSIFDLKLHKQLYPAVYYTNMIKLISITLSSLFENEHLDITQYDSLIMDTQGSELLVLMGAEKLLPHIKYIKTEAADCESYENCCRVDDINAFAINHGYTEIVRHKFKDEPTIGNYYELVYERIQS